MRFRGYIMATIIKTPAGNWKALIRITGHPPRSQTFRVKRDATNWQEQQKMKLFVVFIFRETTLKKTQLLKPWIAISKKLPQ